MRLIQDPPPDYIFELSEGGIAYVRPGIAQPAFEPLGAGRYCAFAHRRQRAQSRCSCAIKSGLWREPPRAQARSRRADSARLLRSRRRAGVRFVSRPIPRNSFRWFASA